MDIHPTYTTPRPPIPGPTLGSEMGSFAHHTVTVRMPGIARRLLADNDFSPGIARRVEALIGELPDGPIRPIQDDSAPDISDWQGYTAPHLGKTWLEVPWFFAEHYFYRRILEATGYFHTGAGLGIDPFAAEKERGLQASLAATQALAAQVENWRWSAHRTQEAVSRLLQAALWGNQGDLSMWPVDKNDRPQHQDASHQDAHLVTDQTAAILATLFNRADRLEQVDLILDNAGFELVCDLLLAEALLSNQLVNSVHLHLKAHPTFVSDATTADVQRTLGFLSGDAHPSLQRLSPNLNDHLESGRLRLFDPFFWNSPLDFWEMPLEIRRGLARAALVISKGDANYRRLLGDRHWPFSTSLKDVLRYFPAPLALLRVLKSETVIGLEPTQPDVLIQQDSGWMTDGRWGLIQFWPGR
jgi:hypothetical protein